MKPFVALAMLFTFGLEAAAQTIAFDQPHAMTGTLYQSSWWDPDDSDYDQWVWDNFTLAASQAITEIRWRGGFNSVVIHYDAPPPTCQDYGVIFLADNMLATLACVSPSIFQQPAEDSICTFGGSNFFAGASGSLPIQHQWQAELDPGVWTDLADGDLIHNSVNLGVVSGATAEWMQIFNVAQFLNDRAGLNIRCAATNACGSGISDVATLTVLATGTGDANVDGVIDGRDIQTFVDLALGGWTSKAGWCASDLDFDGWVDESEVAPFVTAVLGP